MLQRIVAAGLLIGAFASLMFAIDKWVTRPNWALISRILLMCVCNVLVTRTVLIMDKVATKDNALHAAPEKLGDHTMSAVTSAYSSEYNDINKYNDINNEKKLRQVLDALPLGQVVFHHSQEMEVRKAEAVQVRISQSLTEDIVKGLSSSGVTQHDKIPVSAFMKVHLNGEPYFEVKAINDETQLTLEKGFGEWSFIVIPLKQGRWPLRLVVAAVIRTPWGAEAYKDYPVKDELVTVHVTAIGAVESFFFENWQWLWTTIIVPLVGWLLHRHLKQENRIQPRQIRPIGRIRRRIASGR